MESNFMEGILKWTMLPKEHLKIIRIWATDSGHSTNKINPCMVGSLTTHHHQIITGILRINLWEDLLVDQWIVIHNQLINQWSECRSQISTKWTLADIQTPLWTICTIQIWTKDSEVLTKDSPHTINLQVWFTLECQLQCRMINWWWHQITAKQVCRTSTNRNNLMIKFKILRIVNCKTARICLKIMGCPKVWINTISSIKTTWIRVKFQILY